MVHRLTISFETTFDLIAACGQIATHLLHCVHKFASSQTGTKSAIPRFSYCVVPVGKVPSTGNALTGIHHQHQLIFFPKLLLQIHQEHQS